MTTAIINMPIKRRQYRENEAKCARDWAEQLIRARHDFDEAKTRGFEIQATAPFETVDGQYLAIIMWASKSELAAQLDQEMAELNERDAQQLANFNFAINNR